MAVTDTKKLVVELLLENQKLLKNLTVTKTAFSDVGKKSTGIIKTIKENWLKIAGVVATATIAIKKAFDFSKEFAEFQQSAEAMEKRFGVSSDKIIKKLREVSDGTIANKDLILAANRAMALGLTTDIDKIAKLLEIARVRAKNMGIDTTQAFNDIVTGVGRQSPMILDNLGIITKGWLEEAKQAGVAGDTQFFLNKVLEDGEKILAKTGKQTLTSAELFQKAASTIENFKLSIGSKLLPVMEVFLNVTDGLFKKEDSLEKVTKELVKASGDYAKITKTLAEESETLTEKEKAKLEVRRAELKLQITESLKSANKLYNESGKSVENLGKNIEDYNEKIKELRIQLGKENDIEKDRKNILDELKKSFKDETKTDKERLDARREYNRIIQQGMGTISQSQKIATVLYDVLQKEAQATKDITIAKEQQAEAVNTLAIGLKNGVITRQDILGLDKQLLDLAIERSKIITEGGIVEDEKWRKEQERKAIEAEAALLEQELKSSQMIDLHKLRLQLVKEGEDAEEMAKINSIARLQDLVKAHKAAEEKKQKMIDDTVRIGVQSYNLLFDSLIEGLFNTEQTAAQTFRGIAVGFINMIVSEFKTLAAYHLAKGIVNTIFLNLPVAAQNYAAAAKYTAAAIGIKGFSKIIGLQEGGVVENVMGPRIGNEDGLIGIQKGEAVLNRQATINLGEDTINRLNRGETIAPSVNIVVNTNNGKEVVDTLNDYFRQFGGARSIGVG